MSTSSGSHDYGRFDELAEEFAERYRRGERPSLQEYIDRLPQMAEEIREMFPAMVEVEQADGDARGEMLPPPPPVAPHLRQVGDYRILREVGRGGMGAVYEAEQVSLGRRVALKVLPGHVVGDRKALERFRREAKAAARLHHTNIVPVFDVGREGDVSFYAMQLILGQGLDQVIEELRRLREPGRRPDANHPVGPESPEALASATQERVAVSKGHRQRELARTAQSLLSGQLVTEGSGVVMTGSPAATGLVATERFDSGATSTGDPGETRADHPLTSPASESSSSAVLPGGKHVSDVDTSGRRQPYFRSVAQIGRQAAQGLAHAHARGVVHRDIKPSNLLLDTAGVVWITDFGLAKAEDDGLTATGDILGTLRYMAPERFRGEGGARADVYALGITLYELLTLRPGFEAPDRLKLIEQIKNAEPQKPRAVDARIPRDLETIVNRVNRAYREVQDDNVALAEDLLHGCPSERRGWEWHFVERLCNAERLTLDLGNTSVNTLAFSPDGTWAVSGSGAFLGLPVLQGAAVDVWDVSSGRRQSILPGATGTVISVAVSPDGKKIAAGCSAGLVLVWDVETRQVAWSGTAPGLYAMSVAFSPDAKTLAVGYGFYNRDSVGQVRLWDAASGAQIKAFDGPRGGVNSVAFHPDGRRLAVAGSEVVEIWDLETTRKLHDLKGHKKWIYCVAYSPDGKWLATGGWDGTVKLRDAATGAEARTLFAHEGYVLSLAFSPDSRNLVTASEDRSTRLWEVPSGQQLAAFHGHTDFVQAAAFRPDGREVGTGSMDGSIRLWDLRTSRPVVVEHTGWVDRLAFRRDGLRILTETWLYGTRPEPTKGWNPLTGELDAALAGTNFDMLPAEFVRGPSGFFEHPRNGQFTVTSPDGNLFAQTGSMGGSGSASRSKEYAVSAVVIRETATGRVVHTLAGHSAEVVSVGFSPDGRRLATASFDRTMKLWDV